MAAADFPPRYGMSLAILSDSAKMLSAAWHDVGKAMMSAAECQRTWLTKKSYMALPHRFARRPPRSRKALRKMRTKWKQNQRG